MKEDKNAAPVALRCKRLLIAMFSIASISLLLILAGCSKRYHDLMAFSAMPIYDAENQSVGRFKTSYLADQIYAYFKGNVNGPIAIATFVDIDNLYNSSTFGRILSEQLMSELAMRGYTVLEVRQSDALQILNNEGEFGLSRDINTLRGTQEISGLVVGTYAVSPERVYLNTRLIDPNSAIVVSVGSVEMSRTKEISSLLRTNSFPTTLERIPVRQLGIAPVSVPQFWQHWPSQVPFNAPDVQPQSSALEMPSSAAKNSAVEPIL